MSDHMQAALDAASRDADLWERRHDEARSEVERLRAAIEAHRRSIRIGGSPRSGDFTLWAVLDAAASGGQA